MSTHVGTLENKVATLKGTVRERDEVLYFLVLKCLRRGYKLREREPVPSFKERVQWIIAWDVDLSSEVVSCSFRLLSSVLP
jgi:hypothetical protein